MLPIMLNNFVKARSKLLACKHKAVGITPANTNKIIVFQ